MLRIGLAAGLAALFSVSAVGAEPETQMGMSISPNGGNASINQWGGVDDSFSVDPDGNAKADAQSHRDASMAHNQDDDKNSDGNDGDDDPDTNHSDDVLRI